MFIIKHNDKQYLVRFEYTCYKVKPTKMSYELFWSKEAVFAQIKALGLATENDSYQSAINALNNYDEAQHRVAVKKTLHGITDLSGVTVNTRCDIIERVVEADENDKRGFSVKHERVVASGEAIRNTSDMFSKKIGRGNAFKKALKAISQKDVGIKTMILEHKDKDGKRLVETITGVPFV